MKSLSKRTKTLLSSIAGVIGIIAICLIIVYATDINSSFTNPLKQFFPAKIIGNHMVSVYDLERAHRIAKDFDPTATESQVTSQLIRSEKMRNLAESLKIDLKFDDVTDELTYITKNKEVEYREILRNNFGGSETDFRKFVAYPQAWEALLRTHYNTSSQTNSDEYKDALDILERINNGEKFEDLAKQFSDDRISGELGGDLGFVEHGELIPELEEEITISELEKVNQKIISSRFGYHVIYPVETALVDGKKLWHVKHILFQTEGFEAWLSNQTNSIKVWNISN